jgi:hypothetical protein
MMYVMMCDVMMMEAKSEKKKRDEKRGQLVVGSASGDCTTVLGWRPGDAY